MTTGERIRYFRKRLRITQEELARKAGLHPVSVRKYETEKMTPQFEQIEKLANALEINFSALSGTNRTAFRLRTIGDLMGLLITFCDSEVLKINGQRDMTGMIDLHSATICISPRIAQFFWTNEEAISSAQVSLDIFTKKIGNENLLELLLTWEKERYWYRYYNYRLMNRFSKEDAQMRHDAEAKKELIELELQRSTVLLPLPDGALDEIYTP